MLVLYIDDTFPPLPGADIRETAMKTIYILLTRPGTLLSKLVYAATGASYTYASMAFDAELTCPSARRWIWARRPRWSASIPAC